MNIAITKSTVMNRQLCVRTLHVVFSIMLLTSKKAKGKYKSNIVVDYLVASLPLSSDWTPTSTDNRYFVPYKAGCMFTVFKH